MLEAAEDIQSMQSAKAELSDEDLESAGKGGGAAWGITAVISTCNPIFLSL